MNGADPEAGSNISRAYAGYALVLLALINVHAHELPCRRKHAAERGWAAMDAVRFKCSWKSYGI